MRYLAKWTMLVCLLLPCLPAAAEQAALMYMHSTLLIRMKSPADTTAPNAAFNAEIRDAISIARTPDWYNFATLADGHASVQAYPAPSAVTIRASNEFAPVDILMVDAYGAVTQILPAIVPAELAEPIVAQQPALAVIYLKGGTVTRFNIQPGDQVEHGMFRKKPQVLTAQPAPPPVSEAPVPAAPPPPLPLPWMKPAAAPATTSANAPATPPTGQSQQQRELMIDWILKRHAQP